MSWFGGLDGLSGLRDMCCHDMSRFVGEGKFLQDLQLNWKGESMSAHYRGSCEAASKVIDIFSKTAPQFRRKQRRQRLTNRSNYKKTKGRGGTVSSLWFGKFGLKLQVVSNLLILLLLR